VSLKLIAADLILACPNQEPGTTEIPLYIPRELARQRQTFHTPVVLYVSPNNPGATGVASELREGMSNRIDVVMERTSATHMLLYLNEDTYEGDAGMLLADELRAVRGGRGQAATQFFTSSNRSTLPIVMVHENDPGRGGCEFGHFFATVGRCGWAFSGLSLMCVPTLPCFRSADSSRPDQRWAVQGACACALPRALLACKRRTCR